MSTFSRLTISAIALCAVVIMQATTSVISRTTATGYVDCEPYRSSFSQNLIVVSTPSGLFRKTDAGWTKVTSPAAWTQLRATPNKTIFVYDDSNGLFYRSFDLGATWSMSGTFPMASPYVATQFYPSPISGTLFVGLNDYSIQIPGNKAIYKSTNNGGQWNNTGGGAGMYIAFSPGFTQDQTAFESYVIYHGSGVGKSTDGGDSWSFAEEGLLLSFQGLPFELAVSPNYTNDQVVFAVNDTGFYKTINAGTAWVRLRSGKHVTLSPDYGVDQIALLINNNSQLELSKDGAATWQPITIPISTTAQVAALRVIAPFEPPTPTPPPAVPYHYYLPVINAARIQPLEIWLIANDGVGCQLYRSTNFGVTWQEEIVAEVK